MLKKKMSFTKTMMITLVAGMVVGIGVIILREQLQASGQTRLWTTINNIFFADITAEGNESAIGIFYIVGQLFLRSLQLVLVPLIFTSIVKAIGEISDTRLLSKLAGKTFMNFLMLSGAALAFGAIIGMTAYHMGLFAIQTPEGLDVVTDVQSGGNPLMVILNAVNPNVVATLGNNGAILSVVTLALLVGIGFQKLGDKVDVLRKVVTEVHDLTMMFLTWIITKIGPYAIFALLVRTFASYGIQYLQPAMVYMIMTIGALLIFAGVIMPLLIAVFAKVSPWPFMNKMYKVAVFAFSTSSSAATLPLAMETIIDELGVDENIASFIIPLASTLNMTGTAIMQVIATIFIASVGGYTVGTIELASIILLAFIGSVSTPAAPGAGAILLFTIITGMGYSNPAALAAYSFILAINRPVEMLATAVNVLDDGVSSVIIGKDLGMLDEGIYANSDTEIIEAKIETEQEETVKA